MATLNMIRGRNVTAASEGVKPTELPADIQQEQMQLARKQALVDAMLGQTAAYRGNTEMAGNMAIARSPWEAVAQTLSAGLLSHKANKLEGEAKQLPEKLAELNRSEMAQYARLRDGAQLPADQQGPSMPGSQAAADDFGLTSRSNVVQAMTQKRLEREAEMKQMLAERAAEQSTNASIVQAAQGGGAAALAPKAGEIKSYDPKQIAVDTETGQPSNVLNDTVTQAPGPNGVVNQFPSGAQSSVQTSPSINIGGVSVTTKGEGKMAEKLGEFGAEGFKEFAKEAVQAKKMLGTLENMKAKLNSPDGINTGTLASFTNSLGTFADSVGFPLSAEQRQRLANDAGYQSAFAGEIAAYLTAGGGVGRSLTEADRVMLEKQYPQMSQTPQGQRQIIEDLTRRAKGRIEAYGERMRELQAIYPDIANYAKIGMPVPSTVQEAAPTPGASPGTGAGKAIPWNQIKSRPATPGGVR